MLDLLGEHHDEDRGGTPTWSLAQSNDTHDIARTADDLALTCTNAEISQRREFLHQTQLPTVERR
ncbi:hypothetical protein AB0L64_31520 [Kribbella sp. NPDC051936]|uniref:hypothetical protein n=1 Tax=Kribbella sp. NPDC051936 TaxID=3154946 RepID=UPI0034373EE2